MESVKQKKKKGKLKARDDSGLALSQDATSSLTTGPAEPVDDVKIVSSLRASDHLFNPEEKENLIKSQSSSSLSHLDETLNTGLNSLDSIESFGTELEEVRVNVSEIAMAPEPDEESTNLQNYRSNPLDIGHESVRDYQEPCTVRVVMDDFTEFSELSKVISEQSEICPFSEAQLVSLYHNEEIGMCNILIDSFIDLELRSGAVQRHVLYDLLSKYLRCKEKQDSTVAQVEQLVKESKNAQQGLWILEMTKIVEIGECQDGNPVEASHTYQIGRFDDVALSKLTKMLALIRENANDVFALDSYTFYVTKLRIESFIRSITINFSNISHNAPVSLLSEGTVQKTSDICSAISVLFHFLRQPCKDQAFINDVRQWLTALIAVLLRVSSWREHAFILNHVLRCPPAVFKWAACFVQAPLTPYNTGSPIAYLNHMLAMLTTIVSTVKSRDVFISQNKSVEEGDDLWVLVDSDGEDEEDIKLDLLHLRETDIVCLLNQVPFDCLFRQIFDIKRNDESDFFNGLSGGQLLKVFGISRFLIRIINHGLSNYGSSKYLQFSKRLASLILHTTQYVTDAWEVYKKENHDNPDAALFERLQVEYNNIIVGACTTLIQSEQKNVLQFLISLPFSSVSLRVLWRLFHMVMLPHRQGVTCNSGIEWWSGVEELIPSLSDAELCYVLNAVANMALSRSSADWLFVKVVTIHLLQIGFINASTKELCYKTCRTLISNLCSKYPSLISLILNKLKNLIPQAENLSLYLFKEVPVNLWRPTKDDLRLIEHWLLACPQGSIESSLAMFILYGMNWSFTPGSSTELFLPREIHCEAALLIVRFAILHCPESPSSSHTTVIADTIKQLTGASSRAATEQTLNVWVWSMLFKLRLHLLDQPEPAVRTMLANPIQFFSILPSLESLPNELSPLIRALKENQVVAMFTALLMTSTGHSIPLICQSGFQMMKVLLQCHRYMAVLVVLQNIFPLFLECPSSLLHCDKFQSIILGLLGADKTFLKFAMSIISTDFPGLILKQMGDLIEVHFQNYRQYNLVSPAPLIELWLKVLVTTWTHEPIATSYLMDKVLRAAFFCNEMRPVAKGLLFQLLEAQLNSHKPKFSLLSWVCGNNPYGTLMNKTSSDTPWFSFFAIEVEEELLFLKTGLWKHLLLDLSNSSNKVTVDAALKKACAAKNLAGLPSSILPIYRWSQQALDTPVDHPVMPVFWQKFFNLYLARIPNMSHKDYGSVGMRFFEGIANSSFLKRLKKKLTDCKDFYESKLSNPSLVVTKERKDWLESMTRLYSTYFLWLEEVVLHDPNLNLLNLPPPYASQKLSLVFQEVEAIWFEYVDYDAVRNVQTQSSSNWQRCLWRNVVDAAMSKPSTMPEIEPSMRIVQRLQKYENPLPAPFLQPLHSDIEDIPPEALYNKFLLLEILKGSFKALTNYALAFNRRKGEHCSVDCCFLESTTLLYKTVETQITLHAACDTHNPGSHDHRPSVNSLNCAGPAVIQLKVNETHVDKQIDLAIHSNRQDAQALVKRCMQQPNHSVCIASIQVQLAVKALEKKYSELRMIGDVQLLTALHDVGLGLFYQFTSLFNEEVSSYPPMKQLITSCVETLGQCFVSTDENQGPILLSLILENPSLAALLSTHFSPTTCSPNLYIQMYKTLTSSLSSSNNDLMFVLLTKFDVSQWIEIQKPRLAERCQMIELVGEALASIGQDPVQEITVIHEVLRRQLCILMMTDPSQHVTQVIRMTLRHSESHSLANEVWYDVVNALLRPTGVYLKPHSTLAQVVTVMETFAVNQSVLSLPELREIASLLSQYFIDERLQYGLYGLYPKYRKYISPFTALFSAVSFALIATTVRHYINSHASLPEEIWPFVSGLFSPWVCPYFTEALNQPTAAWIQQLTDDRSVLLPWISVDSGHAHKMVAIFTESIRFYLEFNSVNGDLLGYVWSYYVNYFAHTSVKEYILSVMNNNFLSLPWHRFSPKINDVELMLKVSDSYVPFCHSLLGAIFIEIPWMNWVENTLQISPSSAGKIHSSLLHLLVKLTNEPNVRQSGKIFELLRASKSLKWESIDGGSYDAIVNWFVMSYNPKVIFNLDDEDSVIDAAVMELLRYAAGFVHGKGYPVTTTRKRQIYVRASVKLIVTCFSKYKTFASSHQAKVQTAIDDMLILINTVVPQSGGTYAEASLYVAELFTLVNLSNSNLVRLSIDAITAWLSKRGDCIVSSAILKTLGTSVENSSILGEICENALDAIFNDRTGGDWEYILGRLQEPALGRGQLEETLMDEGRFLTIYGFLRKKLYYQLEVSEELNLYTNLSLWMSVVKPSCEFDAKMIPLFHLTLYIASRVADENPTICERNLRMTVQTADSWSEFKPSWGFLGAIGLKKPSTLSNRCKIMMRILSSLILTQLPERKKELPTDQPPFIRTKADAPGGLTSNNMELGPHFDTLKAVSHLESSLGNKAYVELRNIIEISLGFIRKTENSLHNGHQLYLRAAKLLYPEVRYIQCITFGMDSKDK